MQPCSNNSIKKNYWLWLWLLAVNLLTTITFTIGQINTENIIISKDPVVHPDLRKPYKIIYPNALEEREEEHLLERFLPSCASPSTSPCNLITNPFFYPFNVTRLCRCPEGECPTLYAAKNAPDSVQINSREQLKFCTDVPKCDKETQSVLEVKDGVPTNINCFCPRRRRWQPVTEKSSDSRHIEKFNCVHLPKCNATATSSCGYLRLDLFATYQNCTCLSPKLCVPKSQEIVHMDEVMYRGMGLESECKSFN